MHLDDSNTSTCHEIGQSINATFADWGKIEDNKDQWFKREQFLRIISPEVCAYVSTQDPPTLQRACKIGDLYWANHPNARLFR